MDSFILFVYSTLPVLHALAVIAFILKAIIIFKNRGFDVSYIFVSLFRIYDVSEKRMAATPRRLVFMNINNIINYYLYGWAIVTLLMFIIYKAF